jgi:hypothetical protein
VASIAAGDDPLFGGRLAGIAPRARLVVARVLPPAGLIPLEIVLEAMAWAIFEKKADVISMSIGNNQTATSGISIWTKVCEEAVSQGTMVCVAAGNNADGPCPDTIVVPGDARLVVTVGAIDPEGRLADFSARGNREPASPLYGKPNAVAPGVNIVGARSRSADLPVVLGTDGLYTGMSGTSMATPMVAGCLALMKSRALELGWPVPPRELMDIYYAACHALHDENGTPYCPGSEIGHGLVDMQEALSLIEVKRKAARPATADGKESGSSTASATATGPQVQDQAAMPACASCGTEYLSKIGVFSSHQVCHTCGEAICKTCWVRGLRQCARHAGAPASATPAPTPDRPTRPEAIVMQNTPYQVLSKTHTADAFLNGFDKKVRRPGVFRRPGESRDLFVDEKHRFEFVRTFGKVVQYECKAKGVFSGPGMHLSAIVLSAGCGGETGDPPEDLLEQIAGRDGLAVEPNQFHVAGVFCRAGWPAAFLAGDRSRANVQFLFVDPGEGSLWEVHPADSEFGEIFDPEAEDQKDRRAVEGLNSSPGLSTMGGTVALDGLPQRLKLAGRYLEKAVANSRGRFRMVEHRGKKIILRASVL